MKKIILLITGILSALMLQAQVSLTLNVSTAGGLDTALTATQLSTVTNLTLTGTIDARDFVTMRDSMPSLSVIDLSGATIAAYTGLFGTDAQGWVSDVYPANTTPYCAFYNENTSAGKISLTSIILPPSLTAIGDFSFGECAGLTAITIPTSVKSLGTQCFYGCTGLTSVTIPSSVTSISSGAFIYCSGLTSVTIPQSVSTLAPECFSHCSGLTSVTIPTSVTTLGTQCFFGCVKLNSVTIPSSVTSISSGVFAYCSALTAITIPASVTSLSDHCFYGCTGLTSLIALSVVPIDISLSTGIFDGVNASTCTLFVPVGSTSAYQAANIWQNFYTIAEITPVNSITISGGTAITSLGGTLQLTAQVLPNTATDTVVVWSVNNGAAKIDANTGLLTAVANGPITVTATATDGSGVAQTESITISGQSTNFIPVTAITISGGNAITALKGTLQFTTQIAPTNATDTTVTWSVSNDTIATIDNTGLLTAQRNGTVTVTASATDNSGVTRMAIITISGQSTTIPVTSITILGGNTITTLGGTVQLSAQVLPNTATNSSVIWTVSDAAIATVSNTGLVTAVANGTVTITASATDNSGITQTTTITVNIPTGIGVVGKQTITISPNPVSSILNISVEEAVKQIDVINPLGVVVATVAGQSSISVAHVSSGFYILRVTTVDGNALIKTFIKK